MIEEGSRGIILCMRTCHDPVTPSTKIMGNCGHELWAADDTILFAHHAADEKGATVEYICIPCAIINDIPARGRPPEEMIAGLADVLHEDEMNDIREACK